MDVFEFREKLVGEYARFSRSFTKIRATDIKGVVDAAYEKERFWPAPLIQLNPNYDTGGSVNDLIRRGLLHKQCANIFRRKDADGTPGEVFTLYQHQVEGIEAARRNESYVLTTGTGSGKSLSYFIPIVDDVLRRGLKGVRTGITAIVVYPMNALCNSQKEELEKFLVRGYDPGKSPVTFARYTGQESTEERDAIAANPPDILLTNYVMLELIMTRFLPTDMAIRKHAQGLRFLVLDELHTYRGRQGADVAMLVRRVRERFNGNLLCIGTSATMATEGKLHERNERVAAVASRLFGAHVKPKNVITETLKLVTSQEATTDNGALRRAIGGDLPESMDEDEFRHHPVASWVERNLGVELIGGKLTRISQPRSVDEASTMLASAAEVDKETCRDYLAKFLLLALRCTDERGQPLFAFRLHQFISGAASAYATLEAAGNRFVTVNGQQFVPGDRTRALFTLTFCRQCGQEYFPVWASTEGSRLTIFRSRSLFDRSPADADDQLGYFMPDEDGVFDPADLEGSFPDHWTRLHRGRIRLKPYYRKHQPHEVRVNGLGEIDDDGGRGWFVQGRFRFCLGQGCKAEYSANQSEFAKLGGLSSEGRSSATTILALSALRYLVTANLSAETKKLLAFTDNRQDAALQAGHFNDFVQILLLRGALLASMQKERPGHLVDESITQKVFEHLRLKPSQYAKNPAAVGIRAQHTEGALRDVLGYRLYSDLKRGQRINNPNLEQLGLLRIDYHPLAECCQHKESWQSRHRILAGMAPDDRRKLTRDLLERMRRELCIRTRYLGDADLDNLRQRSYTELKEPWGLQENEQPTPGRFMVPRTKSRGPKQILYLSHRSAFGKALRNIVQRNVANGHQPIKVDEETYNAVVDDLLAVLHDWGIVKADRRGRRPNRFQINGSCMRWGSPATGRQREAGQVNQYFRELYRSVANLLQEGYCYLHQMDAAAHTAQVDSDTRKEREERFRRGLELVRSTHGPRGLPVLVCSPTMELGVDISRLNTVYMRNVPPTPANYAQRSGRAGRGGQPALVVTYCTSMSPHDQWFFGHPTRMVAGTVSPPAIDLANEDLIRSHLHAVWLAETGIKLGSQVSEVLDRKQHDTLPVAPSISSELRRDSVREHAKGRAARIMHNLSEELTGDDAPWYSEAWLDSTIRSAYLRFDESFGRWRSQVRAAQGQMKRSDEVMQNLSSSPSESKEAGFKHGQASRQLDLLLSRQGGQNRGRYSEFYTYRYLASEGFLPGYNFPRLPLLAYIPGRSRRVVGDTYLSRPRFLALREFGPRSIIYHEGSTYVVRQAVLPLEKPASANSAGGLPMEAVRLCPECGYGHFNKQRDYEKCVNCDEALEGGLALSNLHRLGQVATRRVTRITSDEEERRRQGYEIITTLRFSEGKDRVRRTDATATRQGKPLLGLSYGPAATIWRINLGWRRRREKTVFGFYINPTTGDWVKETRNASLDTKDKEPDKQQVELVTPFVQDTRNVLVFRPTSPLDSVTATTLMYALKRGIEKEFQLEERELAAEPLPGSDQPNVILFYEAAEGGAGVLTRLVSDKDAIGRVARSALEVCHFRSKSGRWGSFDDLVNDNADCEAGCYQCLLSYFNQTAHAKIDRQDAGFLDLLCRLANGIVRINSCEPDNDVFQRLLNPTLSELERSWLFWLRDGGYRLPDKAGITFKRYDLSVDFLYSSHHAAIFIDGPSHDTDEVQQRDAVITGRLESAGLDVIRFGYDRSSWHEVASESKWVFGPGHDERTN